MVKRVDPWQQPAVSRTFQSSSGAMRIWTADLLRARQLLYQLSYSPLSRPDLYRVGFRADVIHPEAHWLCISLMRERDLNPRPPGYEPGKLTAALPRISYVIIIPHFFEPFQFFFQHFSISESSGYLSIHANIIPEIFRSFHLFFDFFKSPNKWTILEVRWTALSNPTKRIHRTSSFV